MEDSSNRNIDLSGIILLLFFLLLVAGYLRTTKWIPNLELITFSMIIGFILGFIIAKSCFDQVSVFWLFCAYSLGIIPLAILVTSSSSGSFQDYLFNQIYLSGGAILEWSRGGAISSPFLFLVFFTMLFWTLGFYGSYFFVRKGSIFPILFIGLFILAAIEFFLPHEEQKPWMTGLAALITVLFLIRANSQQLFHSMKGMDNNTSVMSDWTFSPILLLVVIVITFSAWSIPEAVRAATPGTPESQKFARFSYEVRDGFNRLTASLRGSSYSGSLGYGPSMALGESISSAITPVFSAEVSHPLSSTDRIYWRGRVYEKYDDGIWQQGEEKQIQLQPGQSIDQNGSLLDTPQIIFRINALSNLGNYFIPGNLVSLNNPAYLIYTPFSEDGKDVISIEPERSVIPGNGYRATVTIAPPTEKILQEDTAPIPDWVKERYLDVPQSISPQIKSLAETITAGANTKFDKTQAITNYLRTHFTYSSDIGVPKNVDDRITWFLFDSKTGFCNYFASAEVLLLRSIGIPARLAVGFAEGEISNNGTLYTVRLKNSHAWPEVYFPETGWVVFEPTPSQPASFFAENRQVKEIEGEIPSGRLTSGKTTISPDQQGPNFPNLVEPELIQKVSKPGNHYELFPAGLFLFSFGMVIGWWYILRFKPYMLQRYLNKAAAFYSSHLKEMPGLLRDSLEILETPDIQRVYNECIELGNLLHADFQENQTPAEKMQALIAKFPEIENEVSSILGDYQSSVYGGKIVDVKIARKALGSMRIKVASRIFRKTLRLRN
jgi:hypothetical protein